MGNRQNEKQILIQTNSYNINSLIVKYSLFKTPVSENNVDFIYGIEVSAQQDKGTYACNERIDDITSDESKAFRIFNILQDGLVTPITFKDVVYDLIG